jgi:large subunit ribosomal protein L23
MRKLSNILLLQIKLPDFENNQYSFVVDRYSDKTRIKAAIEYLFNVKVVKINTCRLPRKKRVGKYLGWKPQYKKSDCNFI